MSFTTSLLAATVSSLSLIVAHFHSKVPYTQSAARILLAFVLLGVVALLVGRSLHRPDILTFGTTLTWRTVLVAVPLAPAMLLARALWPKPQLSPPASPPPTVAPDLACAPLEPGPAPTPEPALASRLSRRTLLKSAAATLPAAAGLFGVGGQIGALESPHIRWISVQAPSGRSSARPLRIAQLSDLHLGLDKNVHDVAATAEALSRQSLDLLVITGDVADRLAELAPALALLNRVPTRLGKFAVLGNHDHFHDVRFVRRTFEASDFHLLTNEHAVIKNEFRAFTIAGIDDPFAAGHRDPLFRDAQFFQRKLDGALSGAPANGLRVILSHRPEAFDAGIVDSVILSGHTHGGQLGVLGVPVVQRISPRRFPYPWGVYEKLGSTLYTTSGFGHWFPFRFGCRAETPVITISG